MTAGLSARLARHIRTVRYEDLPPATVRAAKKSLLDALGVSLAASAEGEGCEAFLALARSAQGAPQSTLLGFAEGAPAHMAALVNGALAHALDFEDAFDGAPLHPNAAMIPAALALAQARGGVSGKGFIAALAVGCDLTCRLGLCLRTQMEEGGWYPPPMLGAYAATAACARILDLSEEQILDALSLTLCQSTCSGEIKYSARSVLRAVRDGFAAQAGVMSAQLAHGGVAGFEEPFEGRAGFFRLYAKSDYDSAILLDDLGVRFWGEQVTYKAWPSCRGTHAFIESALALRSRINLAEIDHVAMQGASLQLMLMQPEAQKRAPKTAIDAKFSLPFTVATALARGRVALDDFTPAALRDEDILALAQRVSYEALPDWPKDQVSGGRMIVRLRDGRQVEHAVAQAFGHPLNPMSESALHEKFTACASRALHPYSPAAVARLAERVLALETEPDMARLLPD